ncbi:hypothetical protein CFIMG_005983RA [Ceratocystis fimbriata CBS 114723]|uniref:DUF7624 domain-containing protein n=1 Tax=Ceratocystis fimbriata CBS 114723 TaxID=1035309 RepID=A0A2C5WW65_9PEZI|nr:hypothetical protein CFIMG_005983RA [Ceratocystis fimbriata CBS 114723]
MALENPIQASSGDPLSSLSLDNTYMPSTNLPSYQNSRNGSSSNKIPAHFDLISPSDIVGPSPVTSNGTASTEIEDNEQANDAGTQSPPSASEPPQLKMLETNIPDSMRLSTGEESISVIHAPQSFLAWSGRDTARSHEASETWESDQDHTADATAISDKSSTHKQNVTERKTPSALVTNIKLTGYNIDVGTPRAQDLSRDFSDSSRGRPRSSSSLEKIEEIEDGDAIMGDGYRRQYSHSGFEVETLTSALQECWTLCNTLSNLSKIHRTRAFGRLETPDAYEKAWKCCWKLCQTLYTNFDDNTKSLHIDKTLELCREFCQSLFDIRLRPDNAGDSVLRVSFELNNHLFSAQDSSTLPEAFRERTLEFYVTLCHRLMKQRAELTMEADSLLRECWSLAEMLFSLRQKSHEKSSSDLVDILESAIQACWQLCDIFREGWSSIRPDRNTPRPQQPNFFAPQLEVTERSLPERNESRASNRSKASKRESLRSERHLPLPPETPVTEFDETPLSPSLSSPVQEPPNILVLGGLNKEGSRNGRWSSSASNMSGFSHTTAKTSSTITTHPQTESFHAMQIKVLILKLAVLAGFDRDSASDGKSGVTSLQSFAMSMDNELFGKTPKSRNLCQNFKRLIIGDLALPNFNQLPPRGKRVSASEMAKSVNVMIRRSAKYEFLQDLFFRVFNFMPDDVEDDGNATFSIFV